MRIESNVTDVLARVRQWQSDIPRAMDNALRPAHWFEFAQRHAQATLNAIAQPEERVFIGQFVEAITATVLAPGGVSLQLSTPFPAVMGVGDYAAARQAASPTGVAPSGPTLFTQQVQEFDDLVTRWVSEEKRHDRRDWGKSDEEIGRWIAYLLLTPDARLSEKEQAAKAKLMPHLADYLARQQMGSRLAPEVVSYWLQAVLLQWTAAFPEAFYQRLQAELAALRNTQQPELLGAR